MKYDNPRMTGMSRYYKVVKFDYRKMKLPRKAAIKEIILGCEPGDYIELSVKRISKAKMEEMSKIKLGVDKKQNSCYKSAVTK